MRYYRTIYYTTRGDLFQTGITGTTDKNGNEPNGSEAAAHTFVEVPPLAGDVAGVVITETFLH